MNEVLNIFLRCNIYINTNLTLRGQCTTLATHFSC